MRRTLPGRHLPPRSQRAQDAIDRGVLSSMLEDPAKRLVETTSRPGRTYTGTDLVVQRFLGPPAGPNDVASLQLAPVSVNARRALGRNRGTITDVLPG